MASTASLLVALLLLTVGISTWAIATESEENNKISGEDESIESRGDYPDIDDLSSFFDFDLGTSSENDKDYPNQFNVPKTSRPSRNKYYYYYKADGPRYYESDYLPKKQVVTPGSHYKPQDDEEVVSEMSSVNDSKSTISQAIVGKYQVSVVDGNSPLLSKLGLKKEDLEKLSGHTKRSIMNASLVGSDSIPSATYAENPRPDYPQSGYTPNHQNSGYAPNHQNSGYASNHPPSGYAPSYSQQSSPNSHSYEPPKYSQNGPDHSERQYRPSNDYYPVDGPQPHRSYGPGPAPAQPPPQGSYDAKSYMAVQNSAQQHQSGYSYGQHPPPAQPAYNQYSGPSQNHYPSPPASYAPKRSSGEPWRQSSPVHTDWDDKQNKKPETYHTHGPHAPHPPPTSYGSTPSNSVQHYPKPSYSSSADKPGYRYATYSKPQTASKPAYSATSSGSSEYSHKPSYHSSSPGYSTSAKAPSRAGSVSYAAPSHNHYHESSKPGITISFKAKSPSHGGGGGGGLKIPVSLNPLEVVKKLLPLSSLNPLSNKKVTIGITIENKKDSHHDYHSY
ncbi:uncharacterized protein NPIL_382731 [Nephila pilipes]|uniref:Uncharacterized protein n=1 Tax=Nephila pilipes TaxID=299642 RepID=A0A8X6QBJ2_NEPPI|nr:uncharacterized protein NPIL_382731 [Nephila pilipes]